MDFREKYSYYQNLTENALNGSLPLPQEEWPSLGPPRLLGEAMRYSLLSGGKRLRPVLLLAAYHLKKSLVEPALPFAVAIEMIHCYSLIHDDLPVLDNDDLRRGKPTNHKVFGEALAMLAGDALLTQAFVLMSSSNLPRAKDASAILAARSGPAGMIAGQVADITLSGSKPDFDMVRYIHQRKTADLLTAAILMGLTLTGADERMLAAGEAYGKNLGLAFQITDDLLDLEGDPGLTGKQGNKDQQLGKLTWPSVVGIKKARQDAREAIEQAVKAADAFGKKGAFLRTLAHRQINRVQ